jgi:hypothetical protein
MGLESTTQGGKTSAINATMGKETQEGLGKDGISITSLFLNEV